MDSGRQITFWPRFSYLFQWSHFFSEKWIVIGAVNNMNSCLGGKMDVMIQRQDQMLDLQHDLIDEVQESRRDLKGYLDRRFEKLESEVTDMRTALKAKGII